MHSVGLHMVSARTGIAVLFLTLAACDDAGDVAAKALDANQNQPGEADARIVEVGTIATRSATIAVDDKEYVVLAQNGDVFHRALASGTFDKLGTTGRSNDSYDDARILLDADFVWIADRVGIVRIPRAGGAPEDMNVGSLEPAGFAQNTTSLFIVASDRKSVKSVDKKSKAATSLPTAFQQIASLADEGDGRLLVADTDAATVSSIPQNGDGEAKVLANNQANPREVAVSGDYVYWYNGGISDHNDVTDRMLRTRLDGTATPSLVAMFDTTIPRAVHTDGQFVYYLDGGGVFRVPAAGGTPSKFVNIAPGDFLLASDHITILEDNSLYTEQAKKDQPNRVVTVTK